MPFSLPANDSRTAIVGSTGSGKTFLACFLLSMADWHRRPWFIFDYKRDKLIGEIGATDISITDDPPLEPGLYRLELIPDMMDQEVSQFFWKILDQENCGIYIDEGYMVNKNDVAFKALLTQGRSKNIQIMTLIQRPVFCSKFVFSEATQYYVMRLQIETDRKYVSDYLDGTQLTRLPRFHSYWYNAEEQEGAHLAPVPNRHKILEIFYRRKAQMEAERQQQQEMETSERFIAI